MGRRSKLTDKQWQEVSRRLLAGEKAADLCREFGISRSAMSEKMAKKTERVRLVAHQVVEAESALSSLPIAEQIETLNYAQKLKSIAYHVSGAADNGAKIAHRLSSIAFLQLDKVDEQDPLKSSDILRTIGVLMKIGNEALTPAADMMSANRERLKRGELDDDTPQPTKVVFEVVDASGEPDDEDGS